MGTFLSYSRTDSDFVDLLHRLLVSKGYDAWIDRRNIAAGSRWDSEIEQAIRQKSHMTVVLSPDSVQSQYVADEWSYALDEGKKVVPVLYRSCDVPMRLRRMNWIDFTKQPFAEAFKAYIAALDEPDYRPNDRFELARREGIVLVDLPKVNIRVGFVYTDYPAASGFLKTVWFALLWSVIPRETVKGLNYDYGERWLLKNSVTGQIYAQPTKDMLLHEIGIEPDSSLEVILME